MDADPSEGEKIMAGEKIEVLIVVDAADAVSHGLQDNVYLVDTNKYGGSSDEGQNELRTKCEEGQIIRWRVTPISEDNKVSITGFSGQIINEHVCQPVPTGNIWEGRVDTQGKRPRTYQYSVTLDIDGKSLTFDPFLDVV